MDFLTMFRKAAMITCVNSLVRLSVLFATYSFLVNGMQSFKPLWK